MMLALGSCRLREERIVEPRGLCEYRLRNLDLVIDGERRHHPDGRPPGRCEASRQLGTRTYFDVAREFTENIVKQVDLVVGIVLLADQKEVGDTPQQLGAPLARPMRDSFLKLGDEGCARGHGKHLWRA